MDWQMVVIRTLAQALDTQRQNRPEQVEPRQPDIHHLHICGTCQSFGWTGERGGRCGLLGKRCSYMDGQECSNWVQRTERIDERFAHTLYEHMTGNEP